MERIDRTADKLSHELKIFVSYSRRDGLAVDLAVEALEARGFKIKIDRRDLPYGEFWQASLADFIAETDVAVWFLSPNSAASRWVNWELGEIERRRKRLIVVRLQDTEPHQIPESIGRIHIFPSTDSFVIDRHLEELEHVLLTDYSWIKEGSRFADLAHQWAKKHHAKRLLLRGSSIAEAENWYGSSPPSAPKPAGEVVDFIIASRRSAVRRTSVTLAACAAIAVSGLLLTGWALYHKSMADAQRIRALHALEQVVSTSNDMSFGLAERLENQKGVPQKLVEDILRKARRPLDALANEASEVPSLALTKSLALMQMSERLTSHEDLALALHSALDARAQLSAVTPPPELAKKFALARFGAEERIGKTQMALGDLRGAKKSLAAALSQIQQLVKIYPNELALTESLAIAHQDIGDLALASSQDGHPEQGKSEAFIAFNEAKAMFWRLLHTSFSSPRLFRESAIVESRLGDLANLDGKHLEALAIFRTYVAAFEKLSSANPSNQQLRRDLSVGLQKAADTYDLLKNFNKALEFAKRDLEVTTSLSQDDPSNLKWLRDLSSSLSHLGLIYDHSGASGLALDAYRRAYEVATRSVLDSETKPSWQRDSAIILENIGRIEARETNLDASTKSYLQALTIRLKLHHNKYPNWRLETEADYRILIRQLGVGKDDRQAVLLASDYVDFVKSDETNVNSKLRRLSRALSTYCWHKMLTKSYADALVACREAETIAPSETWIRVNLAHALMLAGNEPKARLLYEACTRIDGVKLAKQIRDDFAQLRARGIDAPLMKVIAIGANGR